MRRLNGLWHFGFFGSHDSRAQVAFSLDVEVARMLSTDQVARAFDPRRLNLFVLPTEACNFRCTYCYEDFAVGRMSRPIIDGLKTLITNRIPELDSFEISWFGGEPLIARAVVEEISKHVQLISANHSVDYQSNMTTNGFLLNLDTAQTLVRLGITDFQISLDGPHEVHDRSRKKANGQGSFKTIWANLHALRESALRFKITLRVHFSPETVDSTTVLIKQINASFGRDSRFRVFFKAIERLGGPNDNSIPLFRHSNAIRHIDTMKTLLTDNLRGANEPGRHEPYVCYASKPNSLVVRANGDITKCTVALYDQKNRVGKLCQDGSIEMDQTKLRWWIRGFQSMNSQTLMCPLNDSHQ
jgi:uncharacterized protein